jgi:hypothetical protein
MQTAQDGATAILNVMVSKQPGLSASEIRERLPGLARRPPDFTSFNPGYGRLILSLP